jgi:hypothetical protein
MLANENAGAHHLSKNTYVHHYSEGPAERLNGLVTDYQAMNTQQRRPWITKIASKDSRLGKVLNCKESVEYLMALREFRPHFNDDNIFSSLFCSTVVQGVNGAVSGMIFRSRM